MYQRADSLGDTIAALLHSTEMDSLSVIPCHTPILPCTNSKQREPAYNERITKFSLNKKGVDSTYQLTHLGWLVTSIISRLKSGDSSNIPGWAGYNSLLSKSKSLTQVGALPLLPGVAHEWSTLVTVIKQAHALKQLVVGDKYLTVISFDMALYAKVVPLIDSRPDLKRKILPLLGELHAMMAALRALGYSIENSGIDDAWIKADLYGSASTRQILKCIHYKTLSACKHLLLYCSL